MKTLYDSILEILDQGYRTVHRYSENQTRCAYRNDIGQRCIIGHGMPCADLDRLCNSDETISSLVSSIPTIFGVDTGALSFDEIHFLRRLQNAHDSTKSCGIGFRLEFLSKVLASLAIYKQQVPVNPQPSLLSASEITVLTRIYEGLKLEYTKALDGSSIPDDIKLEYTKF